MEMIKRFENELRMSDISESTINSYRSDLMKFYDYCKKTLNDEAVNFGEVLSLVDYMFLEDFRNSLADNYSRATINRVVMSLKSFFNYYSKHTENNYNAASNLRGYKKVNSKEKKSLTSEEVAALINQTQTKRYGEKFVEFNSARDRLIISILATTGLRIEELLGLTFQDMEHHEDYIMINITCHGDSTTKLNKRVPICGKTLTYYNEYMTEYEKKFNIAQEGYLIVSPRSGNKIATKDSNAMLKKYSSELGIEDISNHCFRHFANVRLMAVGTPDSLRNKILGWSTASMGETTYFHNNEEIDKLMVKYCEKVLV